MLPCLILAATMSLNQTATEETSQPASESSASSPERWFFMKLLQGSCAGNLLDCGRIQVSGWSDISYTVGTDRHSNLPMGFNYIPYDLDLQQNWLRIERPVLTSGTSDPSFGFRFDSILPGTDYRFTTVRGLFFSQLTANNGQPNRYGIDLIQFYGEAYLPTLAQGLDIKLGRFFAQFGVETNDAIGNALCSHTYTFVHNPFTHTGILTTTKLTDAWLVQAGLVVGSDDFISAVDNPTFIGGVKWAPPKGRDSVQLSVILGNGRFDQSQNFHNPEIVDLVFTHKINERLNYSLECLYGWTDNVPDTGTADWLGVPNYLTYTLTPRLNTTARLELFDDFQGQRTGFKGLYIDYTAGLGFRPCKAITIRPELRLDYNIESAPFENKHGLFTAATDVILRW